MADQTDPQAREQQIDLLVRRLRAIMRQLEKEPMVEEGERFFAHEVLKDAIAVLRSDPAAQEREDTEAAGFEAGWWARQRRSAESEGGGVLRAEHYVADVAAYRRTRTGGR